MTKSTHLPNTENQSSSLLLSDCPVSFAVRESISGEVTRVVYLWERYVSILEKLKLEWRIQELEAQLALISTEWITNLSMKIGSDLECSSSVKIEIITVSQKEHDLKNPKIKAAVEKLLSYQKEIEYQTKKGRSAKSVDVWLKSAFIDSKKMTIDELKLIPMWAYRQFNSRLYQALMDKKRTKQR